MTLLHDSYRSKKKPVSLDVEPYGPEIAYLPKEILKLLNT